MAGGCCCSSSWSAFSFLHTKKKLFVCLFIFSAHQALKSTFPKQKMLIKMIQYKLKKMGKKKGNISVSRNLSLNTWQVCKTMKGGNMWICEKGFMTAEGLKYVTVFGELILGTRTLYRCTSLASFRCRCKRGAISCHSVRHTSVCHGGVC